MTDLISELGVRMAHLDQALKTLRQNGIALAEAEREYKECVSKEALRLKGEGMAVTLIDKVIYGLPDVSILRFKRDTARVVYEANQEAINITKLQIRIIENQLSREWNNTERGI